MCTSMKIIIIAVFVITMVASHYGNKILDKMDSWFHSKLLSLINKKNILHIVCPYGNMNIENLYNKTPYKC